MKVQAKQYAKLLFEMTENLKKEEDLDAAIKKVAKAIKENKDQKKLVLIQQEFNRIYKEHHGIVEADVISVQLLQAQQLKSIQKTISTKFGTLEENVKLHNITDAGIKGGLIIKIGNEIWDASVKSKLEKLKSVIS